MKSWKIGAIAGLIAGIVLGFALEITSRINLSMGLLHPYWQPIAINNLIVLIPLFGFWGIVLGIIYSRFYSIIPKKGIWKGIVYGLILYFIIGIRIITFDLAYGRIQGSLGNIYLHFINMFVYGLVLGFLYQFLSTRFRFSEKKIKIKEYDIIIGFVPAIIAGFMGGLAAGIMSVLLNSIGLYNIPEGTVPFSFDFWIYLAIDQIGINAIWGIFFWADVFKGL